MISWKTSAAVGAALVVLATGASAAPIPITGYDVANTPESGYGNWANTYNGTITPTGVTILSFGVYNGTIANYTGGTSGTLNDGIIGGPSTGNTQLFVSGGPIPSVLTTSDGNPISPSITLFLGGGRFLIDSIYIYGGNITDPTTGNPNGIPGALTGAIVNLCNNDGGATCNGSIGGITSTPETNNASFPDADDLFLMAGATGIHGLLSTFETQFIVLSDFAGLQSQQWTSISEIQVFGTPVETNATPEPATLALLGLGLAGLGLSSRRKQ